MSHLHHPLGTMKIEAPLLEIIEVFDDEEDREHPDDPAGEPEYQLAFNGSTLAELAAAYRHLGAWLDTKYDDQEVPA